MITYPYHIKSCYQRQIHCLFPASLVFSHTIQKVDALLTVVESYFL